MRRIGSKDRELIRRMVTLAVTAIRSEKPDITPGEVYDAIAAEMEKRCQGIIDADTRRAEV